MAIATAMNRKPAVVTVVTPAARPSRPSSRFVALQALITMNDPQYVEASRHFAERMIEHGSEADQRLEFGFRAVTARFPSSGEKAILKAALEKHLSKYQKSPELAQKLVSVGESPINKDLKASELAAYTMVASLLLNLDETLNKN